MSARIIVLIEGQLMTVTTTKKTIGSVFQWVADRGGVVKQVIKAGR